MKKIITEHEFVNEMTQEKYGFSYEGAKALFEHLKELEENCGKELEFDPAALRQEYTEYENLTAALHDYYDPELKIHYINIGYLKDTECFKNYTNVIEIPFSKKLIIQAF